MSISSRTYLSPFAPSLCGIDVERLLKDMDACFNELCQPHETYPVDVQLQPALVPRIHRDCPAATKSP